MIARLAHLYVGVLLVLDLLLLVLSVGGTLVSFGQMPFTPRGVDIASEVWSCSALALALEAINLMILYPLSWLRSLSDPRLIQRVRFSAIASAVVAGFCLAGHFDYFRPSTR